MRKTGSLTACHQLVQPHGLVPQFQRSQLAELGDGLPVGARASPGRVPGRRLAQSVVPGRHDETRREALEIPLPWRGQRLVEVVDGEDDPPLGGGEPAEVAQVRVPAALHVDAAGRSRAQVGRHREGRPAVERERRADHAPVTQREQFRHAPLLGGEDRLDRVSPSSGRLPDAMRLPRAGLAQRLAGGVLLRPRPRLGTGAAGTGPCRAAAFRGCRRLPILDGGHWNLPSCLRELNDDLDVVRLPVESAHELLRRFAP